MKVLLLFTDETGKHYKEVNEAIDKRFDFLETTGPEKVELREEWYNEATEQYDADKIVEDLGEKYKKPFLYLISKDLYVPRLNFVFGKATPYTGAVLSLKRLRDKGKFEKRLKKEVTHEMGHVFGLDHCSSNCVMRFSESVEEVDRKPLKFCISCKEKLREFKR